MRRRSAIQQRRIRAIRAAGAAPDGRSSGTRTTSGARMRGGIEHHDLLLGCPRRATLPRRGPQATGTRAAVSRASPSVSSDVAATWSITRVSRAAARAESCAWHLGSRRHASASAGRSSSVPSMRASAAHGSPPTFGAASRRRAAQLDVEARRPHTGQQIGNRAPISAVHTSGSSPAGRSTTATSRPRSRRRVEALPECLGHRGDVSVEASCWSKPFRRSTGSPYVVEPGCSLRQGGGGFLDVRRQAGGVEIALAPRQRGGESRCRPGRSSDRRVPMLSISVAAPRQCTRRSARSVTELEEAAPDGEGIRGRTRRATQDRSSLRPPGRTASSRVRFAGQEERVELHVPGADGGRRRPSRHPACISATRCPEPHGGMVVEQHGCQPSSRKRKPASASSSSRTRSTASTGASAIGLEGREYHSRSSGNGTPGCSAAR